MAGLFSRAVLVAGVMAALVGVALGAAPAAPGWLPARTLSEAGADAVIPDIAVDSKGDATVVWQQAQNSEWTVQAVDRPSGGSWSSPVPLSAPAASVQTPQVATAGQRVVAVWVRLDDKSKNQIVQAADRDQRTSTWGPSTSLSTPGRDAQQERIAVNAAGDAVAVWSSVGLNGWTTLAAYRPHGGAWQPAVPLDTPTIGTTSPDVVIDGAGRVVAAWGETSGTLWQVYASSRATNGTWSKPVAISGPDPGTIAPQLALEGNGDVTAVWSRSLDTTVKVIESATRSASNGAWSRVGQLFPAGPDALAPAVAVDKRGDGVIVFTSSSATGLSVAVSVRRPGKAWGRPVMLATTKSGALLPQVAVDARGGIVVVWQHSTGGFSRVQSRSLPAGSSTWTTPRTLSKAGADAVTPQVAVDADGDGAMAWARFGGQSSAIQGDGYDATGPELNKLSIPSSGVAGKRVVFGVTASDVWSAVRTIRWSFGDGAAGSGRTTGHVYKRPGRYQATVTATDSFGHVSSVRRWVSIS